MSQRYSFGKAAKSAPAEKPSAAAGIMQSPAANYGKISGLFVLLLAASAFFGIVSRDLHNQYLSFVLFKPEALPILLRMLLAILFMMVCASLVAVLVRPVWIALLGFFAAYGVIVFFIGITSTTVVVSLIFLILGAGFTLSVMKKLNNQIKYSLHPVVDAQKFVLLALTAILGASFALGYQADVMRRGSVIPAEVKEVAVSYLVETVGKVYETLGIIKDPKQKTAALKELKKEFDKSFVEAEKQIRPSLNMIVIVFGILLFVMLISTLALFTWIPLLILSILFPLLGLARVTRVVKEMKEVSRWTLA